MTKIRKQKTGNVRQKAPALKATDAQVLELWVRAGGRCEFHGCNDYLLQDRLTTTRAKLADIAHIVARSKDGPRGDDPMPLAQRNNIENLFLACTKHHRMIDNKTLVKKYPKGILVQYKQTHEERIRYVTSLGDEYATTVVRLIGNVRGNTATISNEEIREAVLKSSNRYPRYLGGEHHIEIDLSGLPEEGGAEYWMRGMTRIRDIVERMLVPAIQKGEVRHVSLFAFARIPFLAYLGHAVSDKLPLEVYQKHRAGSEGWNWPDNQHDQRFTYIREREGDDKSSVAVMLSLSGQIQLDQLPSEIMNGFTLYSLGPEGAKPGRTLISSKSSLEQFRQTYSGLLRYIEANHPSARAIHVFPAVPISAALILGREIMRNVSPSLIIYDKGAIAFEKAIEIDTTKTS
jgi:hypothetical protein